MMKPLPGRCMAALLLLAAAAWSGGAAAADVEGIRFDERLRLEYGGHELVLNGAGVRTRFIFNVYVIGLYLPQKVFLGRDALQLPGAKRVAITILVGEVTADQFMTAIREKLAATLGTPEGEAIRRGIEHINDIIDNVKLLRRGHTVNLDYVPGHGTRVVINGELRGQPIAGRAFFDALLDGWIGDNPVSEPLKRALLGQET